jgi:hypothetical protein
MYSLLAESSRGVGTAWPVGGFRGGWEGVNEIDPTSPEKRFIPLAKLANLA